ncbi:MAG: C13 family peptidase [Pseudomonadota bacterium]|nr:C13 family peptidase [Pseudomonadota bacterium]
MTNDQTAARADVARHGPCARQSAVIRHALGALQRALWRALALACLLLGLAAAPVAAQPASAVRTLDLPDGGRYQGTLRAGKLHGRGRIDWGQQRVYEGEFAHGFMHGQGRLSYPDFTYEGAFQRGDMHGRGTLKREDGMQYVGEFAHGLMHGQGRLRADDGHVYEGQFADDQPHGEGRLTDSRGNVMEGRFKRGEADGHMRLRWPSLGEQYEGEVSASTPHGNGAWTRADKAVVRGRFAHGRVRGNARIDHADGAVYEGEVAARQAQGAGELRRADGSVYRGRFARDAFDGQGTLTRADGSAQTGHWRAGQYIGTEGDGTLDDTPELAARNNAAALYNQPALLAQQFAQLKASAANAPPRVYALYVAGDGQQEVFRREVAYVDALMARRFGTRGRSVSLVNSRSSAERLPLATAHSIGLALNALAGKMDRQRDLLFVFLTSHGSETHELALGMGDMALPDLPAAQLAALLKGTGIRQQVVVVSACFSGGFVPPLQGDRTWVITASRADRSSFGCADDNQFTYFGRALFEQGLAKGMGLTEAVAHARERVQQWETQGINPAAPQGPSSGKLKPSEPQSVVTPGFAAEVDALLRAVENAEGVTPR